MAKKNIFSRKNIHKFAPLFLATIVITFIIIYLIGVIILCASPVKIESNDFSVPEVTINGEPYITIRAGEEYSDEGATATDDGEEIEVISSGNVNNSVPANYLISYSATDAHGNTTVTSRIVTVLPRSSGVIYLTFDDGPGPYTAELLDILSKYNVKATFFVTGAGSDEMLAREYNEGHAIGLHTYSHDYAYVYSSIDNFFADLYRVQERVKNATGYTSYLMRFPGGSSNTISTRYDGGSHIMSKLVNEVESRGFTYFDWNITSGDTGGATTSDAVYSNVINRVYSDGKSVVLQHDIKGFSVAAVENIIKWGLANGFTFAKLDADSFSAHHSVNN